MWFGEALIIIKSYKYKRDQANGQAKYTMNKQGITLNRAPEKYGHH